MAVPILAILVIAGIFILIALFKDRIIPLALELIIDFIITLVFLGICGIWIKIPKAWLFVLLIIGVIVLFVSHIAQNKEGK